MTARLVHIARRWARDRRGTAALELGLTAIPLMMFLFGIVEMGRLLWLQNALNYSVEEASRCAAINTTTCGNQGQVQTYAAGRSGFGFPATDFTYTSAACGAQVSASYPMTLLIPFYPMSITLTSTSCFPT